MPRKRLGADGKPLEKQIQNEILDYLNRLPHCKAWQTQSGAIYDPTRKTFRKPPKWAPVGVADIIGIWHGYFLAIEVKRPGGRISEHQKQWLSDMVERGAIGMIAYSLSDVVTLLEQIIVVDGEAELKERDPATIC
jgi:hypothetical protein